MHPMHSLRTNLLLVFLVAISWSPLSGQAVEGMDDEIQSARLRALRSELSGRSDETLDQFWETVQAEGTPMIERLPDDSLHLLITFLLRDDEENLDGVMLTSGLTNWAPTQLQRLPNSGVWYRTFRVRADARFTYSLAKMREEDDEPIWRLDPFNPSIVDWPEEESLVELPDARPQPWIVQRENVPSGALFKHRVVSATLENERTIWVYTPVGYRAAGQSYPMVIFFDGDLYLEFIPTPTILDNLIAEEMIPPTVAIFVDNPTPRSRFTELGCNPLLDRFVLTELLPWIRKRYDVARDPSHTVAVGLSRGALAAACLAFRNPEVFGNVLSQSGAFWYRPPWERGQEEMWHADPDTVGYGWLMRRYAEAPRKSIRFYLDIGRFEKDDQPPLWHANAHMRDVLRAKGYSVVFQEFSGGHSSVNWRGTLSDGLVTLLNHHRP